MSAWTFTCLCLVKLYRQFNKLGGRTRAALQWKRDRNAKRIQVPYGQNPDASQSIQVLLLDGLSGVNTEWIGPYRPDATRLFCIATWLLLSVRPLYRWCVKGTRGPTRSNSLFHRNSPTPLVCGTLQNESPLFLHTVFVEKNTFRCRGLLSTMLSSSFIVYEVPPCCNRPLLSKQVPLLFQGLKLATC